jgi:hypothetical protein
MRQAAAVSLTAAAFVLGGAGTALAGLDPLPVPEPPVALPLEAIADDPVATVSSAATSAVAQVSGVVQQVVGRPVPAPQPSPSARPRPSHRPAPVVKRSPRPAVPAHRAIPAPPVAHRAPALSLGGDLASSVVFPDSPAEATRPVGVGTGTQAAPQISADILTSEHRGSLPGALVVVATAAVAAVAAGHARLWRQLLAR